MTSRTPRTRVLHVDRSGCPDGKVCPAVVDVDGVVGFKAVVGTAVGDPSVAAAADAVLHEVAAARALVPDPSVLDSLEQRAAALAALVVVHNPVVATAMEDHVGPGEIVSLVPDRLYDMIRAAP